MSVSFSNLGIQCVKKKDIEDALKVREEIRVDPFKSKKKLNHGSISYLPSNLLTFFFLQMDLLIVHNQPQ